MDNKTRLERLNHAISVMERVAANKKYKFNLATWQSQRAGDATTKQTEQQAVSCGTVCCFGGWLALDKEAQQAGLDVSLCDGRPIYGDDSGSRAVAGYLGVTLREGYDLTMPISYHCDVDQIKPADVIYKLTKLVEKYSQESAA
jgi:hypothetical protein